LEKVRREVARHAEFTSAIEQVIEVNEKICEARPTAGTDVSLRYESFFAGGFVPRAKGNKFSQQHIDFAAGLQQALEKIAMHVLDYWARQTGLVNLCFVGGVAHNSSLNGLILRSKAFKEGLHPSRVP
jgi:predicted NodU family carbamoyl transferase